MAGKTTKSAAASLEDALWESANRLRSSMDAAEYKHVVLGLIFLKYISDVFEQRRVRLDELSRNDKSDYFTSTEAARADLLEDRDEYTGEGVFWVPEGHRWSDLRKSAKQADIGGRIDSAMEAIEKENPTLKGVLPKNYSRRELTPATLGGLIDLFSNELLLLLPPTLTPPPRLPGRHCRMAGRTSRTPMSWRRCSAAGVFGLRVPGLCGESLMRVSGGALRPRMAGFSSGLLGARRPRSMPGMRMPGRSGRVSCPRRPCRRPAAATSPSLR